MTKDGTAEFVAVDARAAAIFDLIYPVGAVFATTGSNPARGTWEEIAQGRTLQGADGNHAAGATIAAGLPNITGSYDDNLGYANSDLMGWHGAVYLGNLASSLITSNRTDDKKQYCHNWKFDASKSNPIYGASDTVQPPAYVVHFYRRTA